MGVTDVVMTLPVGTTFDDFANQGAPAAPDKAAAVISDDGDSTYLRDNVAGHRQTLHHAALAARDVNTVKSKVIARGPATPILLGEMARADETNAEQQLIGEFTNDYADSPLTSAAMDNPYSGDANWTPQNFNDSVGILVLNTMDIINITKWVLEVDFVPEAGGIITFGFSWIPPLLASGLFGNALRAMDGDVLYKAIRQVIGKVEVAPSRYDVQQIIDALAIRPSFSFMG